MIWNEQVKDWLIKNMNKYRNTNGRLSINKMQEGIEQVFSQPMDEGEFIKWTEDRKIKQCDGIKRLKHRLAKRKVKPIKHITRKLISNIALKQFPQNIITENTTGQTVNWRFAQPTISNLETLNYNGKLWISLQDCLKLLNINN